MAENDSNPTHRPIHGGELEPLAYGLVANFHPPVSLVKGGYKFAADISEYLEARTVNFEPSQWVLSQPLGAAAGGTFQVTVQPSTIQFEITSPQHRLDWIANRCLMILQVFSEIFKPKLLLVSGARVAGTMQIDGDAREFLVKHVSSLDPKKFTMLKRPIHLFGIRVFCPPYEKVATTKTNKKKKETIPWQVNIRAESLLEDASKLFLEADAQWPTPTSWTEPNIQEMVKHLGIVAEYLSKDVMEFLQKKATEEETP